ncbi:hypothetical protein DL98DRAFT_219779 [Cadophora sp. DSE1049]|nr:hypothetical protein DL98DRAFT_219779 [Cadophora sp. DSE1049]
MLEKLVNAINDVIGQTTRGADKEIDTESIQPALDSIKEWRLELKQRLKAGPFGSDALAWVLFKIYENKSPFKTIAINGKTGRGQKGESNFYDREYSGTRGTLGSLLKHIRNRLGIWKETPNLNKDKQNYVLYPAVCLAFALFKISVIPYA